MTLPTTALGELSERYWTFRCEEYPIAALLAGVMPSSDRLTRDTPQDHERRAFWAEGTLRELEDVSTDGLSQTERATRSLLHGELTGIVDAFTCQAYLRPSIYPLGPEFLFATWASMTSLSTVQEARHYIDRLGHVGEALGDVRQCLSLGHELGLRYPRLVVERAIEVIEGQASAALETTPYFGPLKALGLRAPASDELIEEGRAVIAGSVLPSLAGYAQFLRDVVLPASRNDLACTGDKDGERHYRYLIRLFTTIDMAPADIHALGLAEVDRLEAAMRNVAAQAGFEEGLAEFKRRLQTDNNQILESGDALREAIEILSKRIDARIPEFFGRIPRATYGVKSIPEAISAAMPPAYAQPNPADNSKAGIHWITSLPSKLPRYTHLPIALHEAWPGHLMHLALIQELVDLPAFRRHGAMNYSACLEGWALYCEGLGEDMGLYDTPEKRYGRLEMEMWRAVRLVVDTGLHSQGWSRDQAIGYFREHLAMATETVEAEVDRYIGLPGQALGYQLGNLKFRELRARAEAALGTRFDLRAFNDALSSAGAVSLPVLEATIEAWLSDQCELSGVSTNGTE